MSISPEDGLLFFGSLAVGIIMGTFGGWVVSAWYEYIKQKNKEEKKEPSAQEPLQKSNRSDDRLGDNNSIFTILFLILCCSSSF